MRSDPASVLIATVLLVLVAAAPCRAADDNQVHAVCDWVPPPPPQKPGEAPMAAMACYPHSCTLDLRDESMAAEVRCMGSYTCEVVNAFRCTVGEDGNLFTCKDVLYGPGTTLPKAHSRGSFTLTKDQMVDTKIRCETMCDVCKTGWKNYRD